MISDKQHRYDVLYMSIAQNVSTMSFANRLKVGSVIVKDGRIMSMGWNGTPAGFDNSCEFESRFGWETRPETLHSELNCISKIARSTDSCANATMYVTHSPCFDCAKLIIQCGISRLVYGDEYRNIDGLELLRKANIIVDKIMHSLD